MSIGKKEIMNCDIADVIKIASQVEQEDKIFRSGAKVIAVGDLHGNVWKLIFFLLRMGIVVCKESTQRELYDAYVNQKYDDFEKAVKELYFHKLFVKSIRLIFIGDTLCDRSESDYMMLLMYSIMAEKKVNFTICLSNHDSGFLYFYENKFNRQLDPLRPINSYDYERLAVDRKESVKYFYEQVYLPRLRIMEYVEIDNNKGAVYSHAPCNEESIDRIMSYLKISMSSSDSVTTIRHKIAAINDLLQLAISRNTFLYSTWIKSNTKTVIYDFIWNRDLNIKFQDKNIVNIFGHLGPRDVVDSNSQVNLDTNIGKSGRELVGDLAIYDINAVSLYALNLFRKNELEIQYQMQKIIKYKKIVCDGLKEIGDSIITGKTNMSFLSKVGYYSPVAQQQACFSLQNKLQQSFVSLTLTKSEYGALKSKELLGRINVLFQKIGFNDFDQFLEFIYVKIN